MALGDQARSQLAHVVIEISDAAWLSNPLPLPDDTRRALETDGRTELPKVLARDEPPGLIRCDVNGYTYSSSKEPS